MANLDEVREGDRENHYRGEIAPERVRDLIRIHRIFKTGVIPPDDTFRTFRIVSIELNDGEGRRFVRGTAAGGGTPRDPLDSFSEAMDDLVEETQWTPLDETE